MDQVIYFFTHLLEAENWPPRWHCGAWSDFHGWLYIVSEIGIWSAYFAISILIIRIISIKKLPLAPIFWLFAGFILLCGLTDAIIFYYPFYRFSALIKFFTAVVSWITVFSLLNVLPRVFSLKTPEELEEEIKHRQEVEFVLRNKAIELETANHELDKFVYSASHDLRAPLASVLGLVNMAREETADEKQKQYCDMIERSIQNLDQFIHEIIDYSKNTRLELITVPVDFDALMKSTLKNHSFSEKFERIRFHYQNQLNSPFYNDPNRIKIILNNLVGNAIKYHNMAQVDPYVEVTIHHLNDGIAINVIDNGNGIEEEYKSKVFDMFYRGSVESKGSGLGLYIVNQIVARLRGRIELTGEFQKGVQMKVFIPNRSNENV